MLERAQSEYFNQKRVKQSFVILVPRFPSPGRPGGGAAPFQFGVWPPEGGAPRSRPAAARARRPPPRLLRRGSPARGSGGGRISVDPSSGPALEVRGDSSNRFSEKDAQGPGASFFFPLR